MSRAWRKVLLFWLEMLGLGLWVRLHRVGAGFFAMSAWMAVVYMLWSLAFDRLFPSGRWPR